MGQKESRGIGVLNLSSATLTIGFSAGMTYYKELEVKQGEIFYRGTGPV